MRHLLVVQPEAEAEMDEVFQELEGVAPGLGGRFLDELADLFELLEVFPRGFQKRRGEYRLGYLKRFPYRVAYLVDAGHVYIYKIAHQHRRPDPEMGP